jgi:glycerol-3-phosphate dehydrogenase (NAD(P)+)
MRITVLGAGYMGSAMAKVAHMRGHDVRLWATWLDDDLVAPVERGEPHPRLQLPLTGIRVFRSAGLADALAGAELVVHAVSSDGVVAVMSKAGPHLPDVPILSVTKGFLPRASEEKGAGGGRSAGGATLAWKMDRIDVVAAEAVARPLKLVHAGGPAKAMEIARGVLTWMVFAGNEAKACADALGGGHLLVEESDDIAGAEICSALKNAYATGLGMFDGHVGRDCHNARAACFTQAIVEMKKIAVAGGGRADTVYGAAGVGDLHVTAAAGRNRAFGERVGRGKPAREVAKEMAAEGQLTEGYAAIASAWRFANDRNVRDLPLLEAINQIVWQDAPVGPTLEKLRWSV